VTIELPNNDIARAASKGVDRRTLLKAGAWAAPVVAIAIATPAATASPFTLAVANFRAIHSSGANYTYRVDVTNDSLTTGATVSVQFYNASTASGTVFATATGSVSANTKSAVSVAVKLPQGQALPTDVTAVVTATGFTGVTGSFTFALGAN
jgi:hypothetical protein